MGRCQAEARELQELQQRLESGFQELNGQRRSADGLERSLERQRQSLEAIRGENARLQAQVSDVRQRCQEQVAKNASLSGDLAAKLQARAEAHTQVALLRAALAPAGSDAAASLEEEIKICRAQIRQVLEQNEALERRIAGTSMRYDPQALSDPFMTFSWYLYKTSGVHPSEWQNCGAGQTAPPPVPRVEKLMKLLRFLRIWEHLYQQLKRIGSIFHALEARDNSWAIDMRRSLTEERAESRPSGQQLPHLKRRTRASYRTAAAKCSPVSAYFHVKVSDELRRRVAEEEEDRRCFHLFCGKQMKAAITRLSTWFDMLLKQVPHSYIQTRHCEDPGRKEWAPMSVRAAVQSAEVTFSKTLHLDVTRGAKEMASTWHFGKETLKPKAVLTPSGLAKRPGDPKSATPRTPRLRSLPGCDRLGRIPQRHNERQVLSPPKPFEYMAESNELEDLGLVYLGASNLRSARQGLGLPPGRTDFLPWDSILASDVGADWPGDASEFSEEALGGTKSVPLHESRLLESAGGGSLCVPDAAALITRHAEIPSDEKKAKALGPRVLRLRKVCGGGHPSLSWDAEEGGNPPSLVGSPRAIVQERRCSNAAFCTRRVEELVTAVGDEGRSYFCSKCRCAYYCSKLCQSNHFVAHQFECKSLRQLRAAAQTLQMGGEQLRVTLAEVLEELLARQVSYESHLEATALCPSVLEALGGQKAPPIADAVHGGPGDLPWPSSRAPGAPALPGRSIASGAADHMDLGVWPAMCASARRKQQSISTVLPSNCVVLLPEDQFQWKVQRQKESDAPHLQASEKELAGRRSRRMFAAQSCNVHTAVGIVRLMSRWASNSLQALKEVTVNGLFFCLITGLCLTEQFALRKLSPETMVAVLSHRMALHVAASQDVSLVPMMRPPAELQETDSSPTGRWNSNGAVMMAP
eukprot:g3402.t1